jgi:ATP-dependent Clp endopeptidase proteolytic subunit ClpP
VVTASEVNAALVAKYEAETASHKALASKLRAEGTFLRRRDAMLKQEQEEADSSVYEQRILEFTREVDEDSVNEAITTLSEWRARGKKPITIRLSSPGGDCVAGLALYDYILSLRAERIRVVTIGIGWAASMAGILLQAGTKRYVTANAHILIHEVAVSGLPHMKIPELEDYAYFLKSLQHRGNLILAERSTLTIEEIEERSKRTDWWLTADEAIELGFADGLWPVTRKR